MKYEIRVDGIVCQHCAKSISETLCRIDGIISHSVDLNNGIITVEVKDESVSVSFIEATICELGFDIV